jgi:serine/threonine protein kinase
LPYNISVDIWAVGILLFFMIFAQYPFQGHGLINDIKRRCSGAGFSVR